MKFSTITTFVAIATVAAAFAGSAQAAQPTQLCAPSAPGTPLVCRIDPSAPVVHVYGTTEACAHTGPITDLNCAPGNKLHPIWGRKAKIRVRIDCLNYDRTITVTGKPKSGKYDHSFKALQPAINAALNGGGSCSVAVSPSKIPNPRSNEMTSISYGIHYKHA